MVARRFFCCCLLFSTFVFAHRPRQVHLVSYDPLLLPSEEFPDRYSLIRKKFNVSFYSDLYRYVKGFTSDSSTLKKIIFFDYCQDPAIGRLPRSKMVCFKWEAIRVSKEWYKYYSRVYSFDDDLVDNKKFFKFYYPALQPMVSSQPSFEDRRPCVMIASNWIPERLKILSFFATKPEGSLEVYGKTFLPKYERMYKGKIPGSYSGKAKLETLKKYRCCICFENTHKVRGRYSQMLCSDLISAPSA